MSISFENKHEELFYHSLRIRMIEEKIVELYPFDKIQSPVHLSIGQETVAVGICQALQQKDWVFGTYRSHAYYLAKGGDLNKMMAELYGKLTGGCKGKAGSMHLTSPEAGYMGSSAIVASSLPHAVGAGLSAKLRKTGQVIVCVFGDGATEEGVYHESLNFASLHNLPILFVCENNDLAIHTRINARQSYQFLNHAQSYGIQTTKIEDGHHIDNVFRTFDQVIKTVRQESKPQFVEIMTYRYKEHVGVNNDYHYGYRDDAELNQWIEKDELINNQTLINKFSKMIQDEIQVAVDFAENSPLADANELLTDVI